MLKNNSKGLIVALVAFSAIAALVTFLLKEPPAPAETVVETPVEKTADAADAVPQAIEPAAALSGPEDRFIGKADAPVTIIEYASMTCSHCAHFVTTVLPDVKKRLIETGKAKLVYRDFPLDGVALKAAMAARCAAPDTYFNLVELIFSNQERWLSNKDPMDGLQQLTALTGMSAETFKACTNDAEMEKSIVAGVKAAQEKFDIKSTPTFIFNNGANIMPGGQSIEKFEEIVNTLMQEGKN